MCQQLIQALCMYYHSYEPYETGIIMIIILQMGKLGHIKFKQFV